MSSRFERAKAKFKKKSAKTLTRSQSLKKQVRGLKREQSGRTIIAQNKIKKLTKERNKRENLIKLQKQVQQLKRDRPGFVNETRKRLAPMRKNARASAQGLQKLALRKLNQRPTRPRRLVSDEEIDRFWFTGAWDMV